MPGEDLDLKRHYLSHHLKTYYHGKVKKNIKAKDREEKNH
jgi:hypothetical protein